MNITIVGAGNVGVQFAAQFAEKNHSVTVFTKKSFYKSNELKVVDKAGHCLHRGFVKKFTSNEREAFSQADIILVTYPAYLFKSIANTIYPYLSPGQAIGLIPGYGGGEYAFKKSMDKGVELFGIQRVPSVARLTDDPSVMTATGYRKTLYLSTMNSNNTDKYCRLFEDIFDMECEPLDCYLNITLTPSNPIIHTSRLFLIFKDYNKDTFYSSVPKFYDTWDDRSSELLLNCDDEVQNIVKSIKGFDLSHTNSLREHYGVCNVKELTRKFLSIEGFRNLDTPSIKTDRGFIPDFEDRYFKADFPYGLNILIQIADFFDVDVQNLKTIFNWYLQLGLNTELFDFREFGINNKNDFINFYKK